MNTERGWSAYPRVVLKYRVVRWVADFHRENPGNLPSNNQIAVTLGASLNDVVEVTAWMAAEGLAQPSDGLVPASYSVYLTAEGMALASQWGADSASSRLRREGCRDALLDLLDEDAKPSDAHGLRADTRGWFLGTQFSEQDCDEAVTHLHEIGLVEATPIAEGAPLHPSLSADGKRCVEQFDGSVVAWQNRGQNRGGDTYTSQVYGSPGAQVMAGSPGGQQSSTVTITNIGRQQLLTIADQIIENVAVLDLDDTSRVEAATAARDLRDLADQPNADKGRARALLGVIATSAAGVVGTESGQALMHLISQGVQAIGS